MCYNPSVADPDLALMFFWMRESVKVVQDIISEDFSTLSESGLRNLYYYRPHEF